MTMIFIQQQPAEQADTLAPSIFLRPRLRLRIYRRAPATTPLGLSYWRVGLNQHSSATLRDADNVEDRTQNPLSEESGSLTPNRMERIASGLNVSVLEFLGFEVAGVRRALTKSGVDYDVLVSAVTKSKRADRKSGAADLFPEFPSC